MCRLDCETAETVLQERRGDGEMEVGAGRGRFPSIGNRESKEGALCSAMLQSPANLCLPSSRDL